LNIFVSSTIKDNFKDVVDLASKIGTNIEISRFIDSNILDNNLDAELNYFSQALRNFQGKVTLHGPFMDLNPASKDSKILQITILRYNQTLKAAKALNTKTIVFHTGYNGLVKSQLYHDKFIEDQITFWQEFIKKFEDNDITIALENTYENTPEVITSIINNVNSKYLKACIDAGHVNINSSMSVTDWINKLGKNLHHMHLHNNFGDADSHNSILSGTLDFKDILDCLEKNNLHPNLIIEIFNEKNSLESIDFIKKQLNLIRSV